MSFNPAANRIGGFTENDGTIDLYLRIKSLVDAQSVVLDLGAGRAAWFEDDPCPTRKDIRLLKGRVKKVIAADVDEAVLDNKASDEQIVMRDNTLDVAMGSIDLVVADYVLEHIDDPAAFAQQINACLKPGGWFVARTPHKYSYMALAASMVSNLNHSKVLKTAQPTRKEIDVFPTRYRMNTLKDIKSAFGGWNDHSFVLRIDPPYHFGKRGVFAVQAAMHRIFPAFFSGNLFIFVQKP